jgi:hypothetical protein
MKLSYNHGRESRSVRRTLGAALHSIGAIKGQGEGQQFSHLFDQAVRQAFHHHLQTGWRPASLFHLIQFLYDQFIFPQTGPAGGWVLFGILFAILRGRDGTMEGVAAHEAYQAYRQAALVHKDIYRRTQDPKSIVMAQLTRYWRRDQWQQALNRLMEIYAVRQRRLIPEFYVQPNMMDGFHLYMAPIRIVQPELNQLHLR